MAIFNKTVKIAPPKSNPTLKLFMLDQAEVSNLIAGHIKKAAFFEGTIVSILLDIKNHLPSWRDEKFLEFLKNKEWQLKNSSKFLPSKTKTLKLVTKLRSEINNLQAKDQNSLNVLCSLPAEMLGNIFSYFNKKHLANVANVCQVFNKTSRRLYPKSFFPSIDSNHYSSMSFKILNPQQPVKDIAIFSTTIATLHENMEVRLSDRSTGVYLDYLKSGHRITAIAKCHTQLWLGDYSGQISIWDTQEKKYIEKFRLHYIAIKALHSLDNDNLLIEFDTSQIARKFYVIDKRKFTIQKNQIPANITSNFSCNSEHIVSVVSSEKLIRLWDKKSLQHKKDWTINHLSPPEQLLIYQNNIIVRYSDHKAQLLDIKSNESSWLLIDYTSLKSMSLLLNGYLVMGSKDGAVRIYDLNTKKYLPEIKTGLKISKIQTASTDQFFVGCTDGNLVKFTLSEVTHTAKFTV